MATRAKRKDELEQHPEATNGPEVAHSWRALLFAPLAAAAGFTLLVFSLTSRLLDRRESQNGSGTRGGKRSSEMKIAHEPGGPPPGSYTREGLGAPSAATAAYLSSLKTRAAHLGSGSFSEGASSDGRAAQGGKVDTPMITPVDEGLPSI